MTASRWGRITLGGAAIVALYAAVPGTAVPAVLLSLLILLAAAVAFRIQQLNNDVFPREWAGYLIAYVCWAVAGLLTALIDTPITRVVAGVTIAVGYVVFASAIVWFHRMRVVGVDRDWMIDATVVSTALAIVIWTSLDVTRTAAEHLTPLEQSAFATAALIHVSFLTLTARLLVITGWRAIRPYLGTSAGLLTAMGSALFFVARTTGTGVPVVAHALWALGMIALASVPVMPPARYMRDDVRQHDRPYIRFSLLASALMVGTIAVLWSRGTTADETVPTGGALLLSLLVLWRMHGLVTANERGKRQMAKLAAEQATLADLGRRSLAQTDVATYMTWAVERIRAALGADACAVLELVPDADRLLLRAGSGAEVDGAGLAALPIAAARPPCLAATSSEPVQVRDVRDDDRFDAAELVDGLAPIASVSARISGTDGLYGVIVVGSDRPGEFSPDELDFVTGAAAVLAVAIDRIVREERVRHAALHDPLTGLPNRTLLFDRLDHALAGAARRTGRTALLFIDLDHFKQVNDQLGHVAGDQLLVETARRLRRIARGNDTLSRLGGDEFVLVAEGIQDDGAARAIAERIVGTIAKPFELLGERVHVSASVGIAVADRSDTTEGLLRRADAAMYQAKDQGRAGLHVAADTTSAAPAAPGG